MDITKFRELRAIVAQLGADPVVAKLDKALKGDGLDLDHPERIIVGETGLFLLNDRGVTRALFYIVNKNIRWGRRATAEKIRKIILQKQFQNTELVKSCHRYHILNCDTLKKAQAEGWRSKYHAANRIDGTFFYRFLDRESILAESKNQQLHVCGNCLKLLSELTGEPYSRSQFLPGAFFDLDLGGLISSNEVDPNCPPAANIYGSDWREISSRYKAMKNYQCEGDDCPHPDLSPSNLKRYLHCHHVDRDKQHTTFFNLRALCVYCHAKQPQHSHMQNSPDLKKYLDLIGLTPER